MADDEELEAIRARRLAEMQQRAASSSSGRGPSAEKQAEMKQEQEDRRRSILQQLLTFEARERLSRIALVKPEKARAVEDMIIRSATSGQLRTKVDEARLIGLLEQISESKPEPKITIKRRNVDDIYKDDDDE
ncbi:programmed cell death protein 5 [Pelomyxa schiedti]|nr:programmed cell death protein 5 [Pelomyxa schiedti]